MSIEIALDQIIPPKLDVRRDVTQTKIDELADSLKSKGLIQAITLRKAGKKYEIIAGHRRFTAAKQLGWKTIRAEVIKANNKETFDLRIHENLHREDLSPIEEADLVGYLHYEKKHDIQEVAKKVSKSVGWVQSRIDLFHMPDETKLAVDNNDITLGVAQVLMEIEDVLYREDLFRRAKFSGLTIKQARLWVMEWKQYAGQDYDRVNQVAIEAGTIDPITPYVRCHICDTDCKSGMHGMLIACPTCHMAILKQRRELSETPTE